ncbi:MAG: general secretion pathway protein GspE [Deltaproteobacteria bacterium]|nr:general secretion pathway protein GspE [Deltaproteobacteria bacterium]
MSTGQPKLRLGELLIAAGVLDETHLNAALAEQRKWGGKLGRVLVDMKLVSEDLMVKALSRQLGLPRIDLDTQQLPQAVTQVLGVDVCERYGVFPVGVDRQRRAIQIAAADPTNYEALDEVAFRTNLKVEPVVATASSVDRAIRRYYYGENPRIGPSATLDPSTYGLEGGRMIDMDDESETDPGSASPPAPAAVRGVAADAIPAGLAELSSRIESLEQTLTAEVRALRALVELLVEQGTIDRDTYLAKVRRG